MEAGCKEQEISPCVRSLDPRDMATGAFQAVCDSQVHFPALRSLDSALGQGVSTPLPVSILPWPPNKAKVWSPPWRLKCCVHSWALSGETAILKTNPDFPALRRTPCSLTSMRFDRLRWKSWLSGTERWQVNLAQFLFIDVLIECLLSMMPHSKHLNVSVPPLILKQP